MPVFSFLKSFLFVAQLLRANSRSASGSRTELYTTSGPIFWPVKMSCCVEVMRPSLETFFSLSWSSRVYLLKLALGLTWLACLRPSPACLGVSIFSTVLSVTKAAA